MKQQNNSNDSYDIMLTELYNNLKSNINKPLIITDIQLESSRVKTIWVNITTIMKSIKRDANIFINFLKNELKVDVTWKSNNKSEGIIIFMKSCKKEQLVSLLKKFINKFVICTSCKSYRTKIKKNKKARLYDLKCYNCKTIYTVQKI